MPEGDTVFQTARRLHGALSGKPLLRADLRVPALATVGLTGATVLGTRPVGKHLLTRFSGGATLHSHLRMDGSWRVHRPGERWRGPGHQARVVLAVADAVAVGFRLHDLALVRTERESELIGHLGPDPLDPEWDAESAAKAVAALRATPDREIGQALLDQRVLAGIGNVYKTEICFLLGVSPWTPVSDVDCEKAVSLARKLLYANVLRAWRSTTGATAPDRRSWVYERTRSGCLRCGGPVRVAWQGEGERRRHCWFCPHCQPGPAPH